jgi:hypothetical protein
VLVQVMKPMIDVKYDSLNEKKCLKQHKSLHWHPILVQKLNPELSLGVIILKDLPRLQDGLSE